MRSLSHARIWGPIVAALVFAYPASALVLKNITLALPEGTSDHGTPGILCTPTKWTDLVSFYILNYVAHAATVLTRPGERSADFAVTVVGCLLLPALGLYRGIEAILSGAVFVKNDDMRKAARSGALCMVVRGGDWKPMEGDIVGPSVFRRGEDRDESVDEPSDRDSTPKETDSLHVIPYQGPWIFSKFGCPTYVKRQIVHGTYTLPEGYRFAIVPSNAQFAAPTNARSTHELSATYNVVKAVIAIAQTGYAFLTLYRTRGDQIDQFGYAAFGLTVAPYGVMSITNLFGNLCRPDYPSLYMVESSIMHEARKRGGLFDGAVGTVEEEKQAHVICTSAASDTEIIKDVQFRTNESGNIVARFTTPSPLPSTSSNEKFAKPESRSSSTREHLFTIKPPPRKLDYRGTAPSPILLIPCSPPLKRLPSPATASSPPTYTTAPPTLSRTHNHLKAQSWHLTMRPAPPTPPPLFLRWRLTKYLLTIFIALTPLALYGGMSHFQPGSIPEKESGKWRAFTMEWLVFGVVSGLWWVLDQEGKDASESWKWNHGPGLRVVLYVVSACPALGGLVVVGQMYARYGSCVWVGG